MRRRNAASVTLVRERVAGAVGVGRAHLGYLGYHHHLSFQRVDCRYPAFLPTFPTIACHGVLVHVVSLFVPCVSQSEVYLTPCAVVNGITLIRRKLS